MKNAIRTNEDARAYLLSTGREPALDRVTEHETLGPLVVTPCPCHRCGGSGYGGWLQDGGRCYECGGIDTRNRVSRVPLKKYAQAAKRRDRAAERKAEQRQQEREELAAEGRAFLAERPELAAALQLEHGILADLAEKLDRFGSLSEKQVALALKIAGELANRAPKVDAPTGRQVVEGLVVSEKCSYGHFGETIRITVRVESEGGEWLANGTAPRALLLADSDLKGCRVRFTATLEPSRDAHFAFFKRPTKAEIVAGHGDSEAA